MKYLLGFMLMMLPLFSHAFEVKIGSAKMQDTSYHGPKKAKENKELRDRLRTVLEKKGYVVVDNSEIEVSLVVTIDEGAIIKFTKDKEELLLQIQKTARPLIKEDNYFIMMFFSDKDAVVDQNMRLVKRALRKLFRALPKASEF